MGFFFNDRQGKVFGSLTNSLGGLFNKEINIDDLSEKKIKQIIDRYVKNKVAEEFKNAGKPVYTQKGNYRVNYINQVEKRKTKISEKIISVEKFSCDFENFCKENYGAIKKKEVNNVIDAYLDKLNNDILKSYDNLVNENEPVSPEVFFETRDKTEGDIVGVYVIYNSTKDMYYVGQAKRLFFRVNQHFTGHGNGDVYADYKYGDDFLIWLVPLVNSGYSDIDYLEKELIKKYDSNNAGYNRTNGNK